MFSHRVCVSLRQCPTRFLITISRIGLSVPARHASGCRLPPYWDEGFHWHALYMYMSQAYQMRENTQVSLVPVEPIFFFKLVSDLKPVLDAISTRFASSHNSIAPYGPELQLWFCRVLRLPSHSPLQFHVLKSSTLYRIPFPVLVISPSHLLGTMAYSVYFLHFLIFSLVCLATQLRSDPPIAQHASVLPNRTRRSRPRTDRTCGQFPTESYSPHLATRILGFHSLQAAGFAEMRIWTRIDLFSF